MMKTCYATIVLAMFMGLANGNLKSLIPLFRKRSVDVVEHPAVVTEQKVDPLTLAAPKHCEAIWEEEVKTMCEIVPTNNLVCRTQLIDHCHNYIETKCRDEPIEKCALKQVCHTRPLGRHKRSDKLHLAPFNFNKKTKGKKHHPLGTLNKFNKFSPVSPKFPLNPVYPWKRSAGEDLYDQLEYTENLVKERTSEFQDIQIEEVDMESLSAAELEEISTVDVTGMNDDEVADLLVASAIDLGTEGDEMEVVDSGDLTEEDLENIVVIQDEINRFELSYDQDESSEGDKMEVFDSGDLTEEDFDNMFDEVIRLKLSYDEEEVCEYVEECSIENQQVCEEVPTQVCVKVEEDACLRSQRCKDVKIKVPKKICHEV